MNTRLKKIIYHLHSVLGVEHFILFGGTALDLIINPKSKINDLDIGIKYSINTIKTVKNNLVQNGYKILGKDRAYLINMNTPVTMVYAQNNKFLLDISFLENLSDVGQFDIESLYCRFPEMDYVNRFSAISAYNDRTITPAKGLDKENPFLLINRVICLSAKYGLSLNNNIQHKKIIEYLKQRILHWNNKENLHGKMAKIAHVSHILKAIARTKNKPLFIKELVNSGILSITFPELQETLSYLNATQLSKANNLNSKEKVAKYMVEISNSANRKILISKFSLLNLRGWDREDSRINLL